MLFSHSPTYCGDGFTIHDLFRTRVPIRSDYQLKNMPEILTIAIPTYNRRNQLERLVQAIVPVLTAEVCLLIVDNHSDYSVAEALENVLGHIPQTQVKIVRNPTNIGMMPNLLRCYELAKTEWVWILGDDDLPSPNALQNMLAAIRKFPGATAINFTSGLAEFFDFKRPDYIVAETIAQLAKSLDSFGNLLFISANVYRTEVMLSQLRVGYMQMQSAGAHVSMLLTALQEGRGACVLHPTRIVEWERPTAGHSWNYAAVSRALPEIFSVVTDARDRSLLAVANRKDHSFAHLPGMPAILRHLIKASPSPSHFALYAAAFFHRAHSSLLYDEGSLSSVARKVLLFCALLLGRRALRLAHWTYCRIFGKQYVPNEEPSALLAFSLLSDKRM